MIMLRENLVCDTFSGCYTVSLTVDVIMIQMRGY